MGEARARLTTRALVPLALALGTAAFALILTLGTPAPARASDLRERVDLDLESNVALAVDTRDGTSQKLEWTLEPDVRASLPLDVQMRAVGRLRGDVFDRLEPGRPAQDAVAPATRRLFLDEHWELELRELHFERRFGRALVRLGKQQVVWGQADGLKVLDVVDPQVLREFILPPFDESRIPLWTANAELPVGPANLQLLWIPDPSYDDFPEPGARYAVTTPLIVPVAPPGANVRVRKVERPAGGLGRISDGGARVSGFFRGWDWSLDYLYHYDDVPVFYRQPALVAGAPGVEVTPRYERTHLAGASFSNTFGDWTLRGELAGNLRRFLPNNDPGDADGVTRTDEFAYVLGLDWYGIRETLVSGQLFQSVITNREPGVFRNTVESVVTLLVRHELWNDRLTLECQWLQSLNRGDGLVRPRVRFELNDELAVRAGFDVFYGNRAGLFGEFDRNDRFVLALEGGWTDLF